MTAAINENTQSTHGFCWVQKSRIGFGRVSGKWMVTCNLWHGIRLQTKRSVGILCMHLHCVHPRPNPLTSAVNLPLNPASAVDVMRCRSTVSNTTPQPLCTEDSLADYHGNAGKLTKREIYSIHHRYSSFAR